MKVLIARFVPRGHEKPVTTLLLDAPSEGQIRRLGSMERQITVPDDFDSMGAKEIELFFGDDE